MPFSHLSFRSALLAVNAVALSLSFDSYSHYDFASDAENSEVRNNTTYGVIKLTLHARSYAWQFVPVRGRHFTDKGSSCCH